MQTTLSHVDGRSMDVVILSRGKAQVDFKRVSDGRRFSCGIRDLSLLSKCKVYWYFRASGGANVAERKVGVGDLHLRGMREEMADLMEDLRLAEYRLNAAETGAQRRTIDNDIESLQLDVSKLELKQADYLSHRQ